MYLGVPLFGETTISYGAKMRVMYRLYGAYVSVGEKDDIGVQCLDSELGSRVWYDYLSVFFFCRLDPQFKDSGNMDTYFQI